MTQYIFYSLFLIAGITGAIIFFRLRLKKIISDLDQKISSAMPAYSPDSASSLSNASGTFEELASLGNKIAAIPALKIENPAAVAINNESAIKSETIQKRFDNLQVVNELGQRVTASLSLEDVFQNLFFTINSMMDAAVFELGVYYWKENRWQILSNLNPIHPDGNSGEEYHNQMAEWCLHNNREILLGDAEKEFARYVFKPLVTADGRAAQSVMSFPIYRSNKERGTLTVISFRKNAFNDYHVEMIRSLLPYVAVALDNALVHKELIVTQNQLIHNEKMASIGQLSSGIAHEILNPLNFVNNFSELVLRS